MGLPCTRAADQNGVLRAVKEFASMTLTHRRLVNLAGCEVEAGEILQRIPVPKLPRYRNHSPQGSSAKAATDERSNTSTVTRSVEVRIRPYGRQYDGDEPQGASIHKKTFHAVRRPCFVRHFGRTAACLNLGARTCRSTPRRHGDRLDKLISHGVCHRDIHMARTSTG